MKNRTSLSVSPSAPSAWHGAVRLHVEEAGSGWELLMQSGVEIACTTGISLDELLSRELEIPPDDLPRIDVLLLDGKSVDSPKTTVVPDGSRLALAVGLPGIAGMAMRSNSPVRGLRPDVTSREGGIAGPGPGRIELALFCLALPMLGRHVLARGVLMPAGRLAPYLRPALRGECVFAEARLDPEEARRRLEALPPETPVHFSVEAK